MNEQKIEEPLSKWVLENLKQDNINARQMNDGMYVYFGEVLRLIKLKLSERQTPTEPNKEADTKQLIIGDVSGHVPVEISDFLHRLRLAEHPEIKKSAVDLFNRYCR